MSKTAIIELRQKRAKLIADARALNDKILDEKRDFTAEEQNNWDRMMGDADGLKTKIDREERLMTLEGDLDTPVTNGQRPDPEQRGQERMEFRSRAMQGLAQMEPEWRNSPEWRPVLATGAAQYRQGFGGWLRHGQISAELRAVLQADLDIGGGYLTAPVQFVDGLLKTVDDMVLMRQWATVYAVPSAQSLGVATLESDPADADWTSELATGTEDTGMSFGRRSLHPHPLAKRIKISNKLIRMVPNSEGLARDRLGYKFGTTQEKGFLLGNGVNQPLGVFVASNDGIPTSRDVSTDNTSTDITFDGLINAKFALKPQYWGRAKWMVHRDFVKSASKKKDNDGQYIWRESVRVGEPDRILNIPVYTNEFAPNTFTTGQYVGVLGDFSNYWIADAIGSMIVQRLVELYAETNQVGLICRLETDGQPVLAEAFVRVKLG